MFKSGVSCQFSFEIDPATLHLRLESPFLRVTRSTAYFEVLNACASTGIGAFLFGSPSQSKAWWCQPQAKFPSRKNAILMKIEQKNHQNLVKVSSEFGLDMFGPSASKSTEALTWH